MIWRIRERSVFARFARDGHRARAGVLWCSFLPDPSATPPRVAFAIGRATGSAVVRNRLRRRLRAILATADLPAGWFLVGARPAAAGRSFRELTCDVERLAAQLARLPAVSGASLSNTSSTPTPAMVRDLRDSSES